jgi:hypothetical protein
MLKRTVVLLASAAFFWGIAPTQTAARTGDDMWDLMNPSWWADRIFDNDDDDWWYYRHRAYNPYWGVPYAQRPRVIVIQQEPDTKEQNPDTTLPE